MLGKLRTAWRNGALKTRIALVGAAFYGLYLLYVLANRLLIADGDNDPINIFLGIERRDQFFLITLPILIGFACLAAQFLHRRALLKPAVTPGARRAMLIVLALIFANALASSAAGVVEDMNGRFLLPLYAWVAVVLGLQIVIAALALPRISTVALQLSLLASLGVLAFFALNFSLAEWFRTGSLATQLFGLVVTTIVIAAFFGAVLFRLEAWRKVALVLILTFCAPIVSAGIKYVAVTLEQAGSLERFSSIKLASTPDIHIVSLDALAPPELAGRYLDVETVPYAKALNAPGVRRFPNAFASSVPTKSSLNSVMRLAQGDFPPRLDYFSGRRASPLSTLLHSNGYHVATGFPIIYMGFKGRHIDSYRPDPTLVVANSALCILADASPLAFFGFCQVGTVLDKEYVERPWPDQVVKLLEDYLARGEGPPVFTYHHILKPIGHTSLDYRTGDNESRRKFRRFFLAQAANADRLIQRLSSLGSQSSRRSIIILTGDHGLWISRTVGIDDNPSLFVQDRHGIVLATLLDQSGCPPGAVGRFMSAYATPERLLGGILQCLSVDPARTEAALRFSEPIDFAKHLYEGMN